MADNSIGPGFLTASASEQIAMMLMMSASNKDRLDNRQERQYDEFPAKLTGVASNGAYAWTEQWYDANGSRVTLDNGRSGSSSYSPAYPVGNGVLAGVFPIEVWLRLRIVTETLGPVYEFDWVCACSSYYSGSGSGG